MYSYHLIGFRVIFVILKVSEVFWSFYRFRKYFGHFFRFRWYFGQFLGFWSIVIIF